MGVVSLAKCRVIYSANPGAISELAETGQRSKYVLTALEEMLGDILPTWTFAWGPGSPTTGSTVSPSWPGVPKA